MRNWNQGGIDGVEQLLSYFALPQRIPRDCKTTEQRLRFLRQQTPVLLTPVTLDAGWSRSMTGPVLLFDENGLCHLATPSSAGGYCFWDEGAGKSRRITSKNELLFQKEGYGASLSLTKAKLFAKAFWGGVTRYAGITATLLTVLIAGGTAMGAYFCGQALASLSMAAEREQFLQWAAAALLPLGIGAFAWWTRERLLLRALEERVMSLLPAFLQKERTADSDGLFCTLPEDLRRAGVGLRAAEDILQLLLAAVAGVFLFPQGGGLLAVVLLLLPLVAAGCWLLCFKRPGEPEEERRFPRWLGGALLRLPQKPESGRPGVTMLLLLAVAACWCASRTGAVAASGAILLYAAFSMLPGFLLFTRASSAGKAAARLCRLLERLRDKPMKPPLPESAETVLELWEVCFRYPGGEPLLDHINLRVRKGERVGVLGAVGVGKTTLARVAAGALLPNSGLVTYGGFDLSRYLPESLNPAAVALLDGRKIPENFPELGTAVVFSVREEDLRGCGRQYELKKGKLYERSEN